MKKVGYILVTTVLAVILFVGCERTNTLASADTSVSNNDAQQKSIYSGAKSVGSEESFSGEFHNNGLKYLYGGLEDLKNSYNGTKLTKNNWWGTNEELEEQSKILLTNYFIDETNGQINSGEIQSMFEAGQSSLNISVQDLTEAINSSGLNPAVKQYSMEIINIDKKNYGTVVSSLMDIRNKARKELTGEELITFMNIIDVGLSSAKYWKDNLENWNILFNVEIDDQSLCFSFWGDIFLGDLIGGLSVLVSGNTDPYAIGGAALAASALTYIDKKDSVNSR
ncbi:MAG TPA: hypothetical protein PLK90_05340 [Clostridiales bacterium]|nr:hypothetical protein [Clostridiales bacterium]HQP69805.1 hypothetical protein [Clostridiales bacterium]